MKKYDRLIFVSIGDTVTAPMAEAIMQSKYLLDELDITSKGLVVLFPEPINPKAEAILAGRGMTMKDHMSDPLVQEDLNDRTLILTMTEDVRKKVLGTFPEGTEEMVKVLNQMVGEEDEIKNPYGGSLEDYGKCFDQLNEMISKLVVQLNEEELLC